MPSAVQCSNCTNYIGLGVCLAFPKRIPDIIWEGKFDHKKPFKNDNGIRFKQKTFRKIFDITRGK